MAKCKVCEYCGSNLDFGERCDCQDCKDLKSLVYPCVGG